MKREALILTAAGLLHDIGKVIYRAGIIDGRNHSTSGADFISEITPEKELARVKLAEDALATLPTLLTTFPPAQTGGIGRWRVIQALLALTGRCLWNQFSMFVIPKKSTWARGGVDGPPGRAAGIGGIPVALRAPSIPPIPESPQHTIFVL